MRISTALTALAAALTLACGGPTGPSEQTLPPGEVSLAIVDGDSQTVAVTDTLPFDAITRVTKGGEPLADQLIDWKVTEAGCGAPFVSTTRTDSAGKTGNRAVAGTRAWTRPDAEKFCRLEVRYALTQDDSVIAEVDTAFHYLVEPGAAVENRVRGTEFTDKGARIVSADAVVDQYGNPVIFTLEPTCCAHRQGSEPGTENYRTLVVDSAGTGEVRMTVADTLVDRALLEVSADSIIRIDFAAR